MYLLLQLDDEEVFVPSDWRASAGGQRVRGGTG